MQFFDHLQSTTAESRNYLLSAPVIAAVYEGRFDVSTYVAFLNQAYHHVKHTTSLLMAAGARMPDRLNWVREILSTYIQEEMGHEEWILDDLEALGCDRKVYASASAPFRSRVLVSYLYDYINRENPAGIFGMVQVLEGTSASLAPEVARIVQQKLDLPDAATTYLITHGELDQEHMCFFEKAMNRLDDVQDQQAVIEVAQAVYQLYGDVYRTLPIAESVQETVPQFSESHPVLRAVL